MMEEFITAAKSISQTAVTYSSRPHIEESGSMFFQDAMRWIEHLQAQLK